MPDLFGLEQQTPRINDRLESAALAPQPHPHKLTEGLTMNENTPEQIEGLTIERAADGYILLEQDSGGNIDRVAIHPIHLRYMAEQFGLEATSDPQAAKTIAMLTRRLLVLNDRIDHLADWLANHSDHKHADLTHEMTYARATADIAAEFCAELDTVPQDATPAPAPTAKPALEPAAKATPPQASLI